MPGGDGTGPEGKGPGTGRGIGRGGGKGRQGGSSMGPEGNCICPKCQTKVEHQVGIPCNEMNCPKCGTKMTRE